MTDGCCNFIQGDREPKEATLATFSFMIRETFTETVTVEAETYDKARAEVERQYDEGEINLDRNCYAGVEYRPQCSQCESDFDDDPNDLREVNSDTPQVMVLCDRCVADMEDSGELTRCDACEDLFSPARMQMNPQNQVMELCPLCGEVWCD